MQRGCSSVYCCTASLQSRLASDARALLWMAGAFLIALGVLASTAVVLAFRKAATAVSPLRPATSLVRGGPYRYSRNPDYIGQTAIYVGIAVAADTWSRASCSPLPQVWCQARRCWWIMC